MPKRFKEEMGELAYQQLNELLKRETNIRNFKNELDFAVQKEAIDLLLQWIGSIYDLTKEHKPTNDNDIDLNRLYIDNDN
jgi:hypothetical protein